MPHIEPFLSLHLLHAKARFPLFRDGLSQCFGNPPQGSPWTSCLLRSSSRIGLARASFSTLAPRDAGMPRNLVTRMFLWFLPSSSGSHHKVCATFPALGALQCWNKTCIDGTRHFSDPSQIRAFAVELSWQLSSTVCVFIETFSTSPGQFLMNSRGDAFCGAASASPVCCGRMVLLAASSSALLGARKVDVFERFCMPRDRFPTECFGTKSATLLSLSTGRTLKLPDHPGSCNHEECYIMCFMRRCLVCGGVAPWPSRRSPIPRATPPRNLP